MMIKISKILISLFLTIVLLAETATAQMVELKKEKNRVKEELKVAAFLDYPPFGNYANPPRRPATASAAFFSRLSKTTRPSRILK